MGELGKEFTQKNFAWGKIGEQTKDLYREVLKQIPLDELIVFQWGKAAE
jgi:hypothetical protein